jgi:hypothetical protein
MTSDCALSRASTEGFAARVRKNLDFIIRMKAQGEDVHEVTQLVTSLLGLIVFPWEAYALKGLEAEPLSALQQKGWPPWNIQLDEKGDTTTLGRLTWHLRNAASHRRVRFSSDEPDLANVVIVFEDMPNRPGANVNWRAAIRADQLKSFCDQFTSELRERAG